MLKIFTLLTAGVVIITLSSCENRNIPAGGDEDEIYVVADSAEYEELKPVLETTFEKTIYTPQAEKLFTLKRIPPNYIEGSETKKNIIIIAPLNTSSSTSKLIEAVLDTTAKRKIRDNNNYIEKKYNLWAKNQLVVLLTAPNMQDLQEKISQNKDDLVNAFQDISDKRLYKSLYNEKNEQEAIEGKLLQDYGWIIYVQSGYNLKTNDPGHNFVCFKNAAGNDMEKWIFIHWIDNASPAYLNEDSIRAIRNRLTGMFYQKEYDKNLSVIANDCYTTNEVDFKGRYAVCTQGLWEIKDSKMNGPFINYSFYDENNKKVYMLDGAVYAPKYYKRNLIQQMDVMLQSFMTENELTQNRKDELIKAASDISNK